MTTHITYNNIRVTYENESEAQYRIAVLKGANARFTVEYGEEPSGHQMPEPNQLCMVRDHKVREWIPAVFLGVSKTGVAITTSGAQWVYCRALTSVESTQFMHAYVASQRAEGL